MKEYGLTYRESQRMYREMRDALHPGLRAVDLERHRELADAIADRIVEESIDVFEGGEEFGEEDEYP